MSPPGRFSVCFLLLFPWGLAYQGEAGRNAGAPPDNAPVMFDHIGRKNISYRDNMHGAICPYYSCGEDFFCLCSVTPVLESGHPRRRFMLIALSAAAAACGYGILLGTMARTYEQASTFGAVSVVIAAAMGGIMVPVFAMPPMMQKISLFSPLSWGLNAFLDVFVRGGNLRSVLPDIALLLLFFLVTTLLAWFNLSRKGRIRIH